MGRERLQCIIAAAALSGCAPEPGFFFPSNPINSVSIYLPLYEVIQVGETARIDAAGYYNGTGMGVEPPRSVLFESSDPTTLRLTPTTWTMPSMPSVSARGLKEGFATIKVTINGVTATSALSVIPEVASITVTPSTATLYVGDTIAVNVAVRATDGRILGSPTPHLQIADDKYGIVYFVGRRVLGYAPGTVSIFANIGADTGRTTLTVLARP